MNRTADVVVVGAGIVGAAVAHRAAQAGLRVVMCERGRAGSQGSGTTAGNVHIQAIHTRRPGQAVPVDVRRLLPLQRAARDIWQTWEQEIGPVGFRRSGGLMVAETPDQVDDLHDKYSWERASGVKTEVLDAEQARAALPALGPTVAAATWCAEDGFADPALVTPALVRRSLELGATLQEGTAVDAITRQGNEWRVRAGESQWTAPIVVNAAGPWINDIAAMTGIELALTPLSIQMHVLGSGGPELPYVIAHVGEGMSVKQTVNGEIMIGGGWPAGPFRPDGTADVNPASVTGNLAQVRRILPGIGRRPLARSWTGPLAATPDEMPLIGEIPEQRGIFVAGGTYSFTFAPLWGKIVVDLLMSTGTNIDIDDLGPARLMPAGRA